MMPQCIVGAYRVKNRSHMTGVDLRRLRGVMLVTVCSHV